MISTIRMAFTLLDRHDRRAAAMLLCVILVMACLEVFGVGAVFWFFALIVNPDGINDYAILAAAMDWTGTPSTGDFVVIVGVALFVAILVRNMFAAFTVYAQERFVLGRNLGISLRLLHKFVRLPYLRHLNENSADLTKRVLNDVWRVATGIILPIVDIASKTIIAAALVLFLMWTDFILTSLVLTVIIGTAVLIYLPIRQRLHTLGEGLMNTDSQRFRSLAELFGGIKDIKIFGRERFFEDRYRDAAATHRRLVLQHKVISQLPHFSLETLAVGTILMVILYVQVTTGDAASVVTTATLYAVASYRLLPAVKVIALAINEMRLSRPFLDALVHDLSREPPNEPPSRRGTPLTLRERLALKDLFFTYDGTERPTVADINVTIPKKTSVAFVGPTGAGKTTLMDLILGLIQPSRGTITIDGMPIMPGNVRDWQDSIGYVPQHIFLTDGTIRNNVAFGIHDDEVDEQALSAATRLASIDRFIERELPDGYNTLVGERGVRLSGGERQRIGIARALYNKPSLLVLDEATSALDGRTEAVISDAIADLSHEITLIVVAHRLSTVRHCDMIYLMDGGRIVDSGNYDDLLARNDTFRAMARA